MGRKTQHVIPSSDGGWSVKKGGAIRVTKKFDTKAEALKYGKKVSINQGAELVVHKRDGTILNPNSYGKDPIPPRDKVK